MIEAVYNCRDQLDEARKRIAELEIRIDVLGGQAKHYKAGAEHWEATCQSQWETGQQTERDCNRLTMSLAEIREVWAGSDGLMPQTAPEGYLVRLLIQCYEISTEALEK